MCVDLLFSCSAAISISSTCRWVSRSYLLCFETANHPRGPVMLLIEVQECSAVAALGGPISDMGSIFQSVRFFATSALHAHCTELTSTNASPSQNTTKDHHYPHPAVSCGSVSSPCPHAHLHARNGDISEWDLWYSALTGFSLTPASRVATEPRLLDTFSTSHHFHHSARTCLLKTFMFPVNGLSTRWPQHSAQRIPYFKCRSESQTGMVSMCSFSIMSSQS